MKTIKLFVILGILGIAACGNNNSGGSGSGAGAPPPPPPGYGYGGGGNVQQLPTTGLQTGPGAFIANNLDVPYGAGPVIMREFMFSTGIGGNFLVFEGRNQTSNCPNGGILLGNVVYQLISSSGQVMNLLQVTAQQWQAPTNLNPDTFRLRVTYNNVGSCNTVFYEFGASLN